MIGYVLTGLSLKEGKEKTKKRKEQKGEHKKIKEKKRKWKERKEKTKKKKSRQSKIQKLNNYLSSFHEISGSMSKEKQNVNKSHQHPFSLKMHVFKTYYYYCPTLSEFREVDDSKEQ